MLRYSDMHILYMCVMKFVHVASIVDRDQCSPLSRVPFETPSRIQIYQALLKIDIRGR